LLDTYFKKSRSKNLFISFTKRGWFILYAIIVSSYQLPDTNQEIISKMLQAVDDLKTCQFSLKTTERLNKNQYKVFNIFVKKRKDPLAIYARVLENQQELLYDIRKNKNAALINPNGFPYINLNLDITSSVLRERNHHICTDIGFEPFTLLMKKTLQKMPNQFYQYLSNQGAVVYNGVRCIKMQIDYTEYKIINYTCQKGETLTTIANKFFLSDYKLLQLNKEEVDNYNDVKEGQIIKIPNAYGKEIIFYIDEKTFLPIYQKVNDEIGLYELYEFSDIKINPPFTDYDFSSNNKEYGF
jgi:outer membrane lipoprotein-sorting protein